MEFKVHQWLDESQRRQWVCTHISDLVAHLAKVGGNSVKAVGLVNYRSPSAVVFLEKPLQEDETLPFVRSHSELKPVFDGMNHLCAVRCEEHFVDVEQWNEAYQ